MLKSSYYKALFIECQMKGKPFYHVSLWFTDVYSSYFFRALKQKSKIFVMLRSLLDESGCIFYIFYYLINLYLWIQNGNIVLIDPL